MQNISNIVRATLIKRGFVKIRNAGHARISSKFYNCSRLEGKGNKRTQETTWVEVFHCE
jgi:hypothetical protein